jgi:hypothetical protein
MAISVIGDIIKEIRDLIGGETTKQGVKDGKEIANLISGRQVFRLDASIARQARRNTAVFPILAVDTAEPEQLFKLQKRLEGNIASMLLLCIQNGNDLIDMSNPDGKRQFIDQYTGGGQGLMDFGIPGMQGVVGTEGSNPLLNPENFKKAFKTAFDAQNTDFESYLDMSILDCPRMGWYDDASNLGSSGVGTVAPVSSPAPAGGVSTWNPQDQEPEDSDTPDADDMSLGSEAGGAAGLARERARERSQRVNNPVGRSGGSGNDPDDGGDSTESTRIRSGTDGSGETNPKHNKWYREMAAIQKKADEAEATVVSADVIVRDEHGIAGNTRIAFGVKTTLHMFPADEMAEAIKDTYSESSLLIRLIRWRAGELSFIRDVVLNMKEIKQTVASKLNRHGQTGPKAIFASMRFKIKNAVMANAAATKDGKVLPTAILCVTMDEVEEVKRTCGKDFFKKMKDARELCEKLGLFGIVILEPATNSYYSFFDDGSVSYAKNSIKPENKKDEDGIVRAVFGALKR